MENKTILPGYKHFLFEFAASGDLTRHVVVADQQLAKLSWLSFWDRSHTVRFVINDQVQTPLTIVTAGAPPEEISIGVTWRDRSKAIEIQLPGNLLEMPFFAGLGSPAQIALLTLAHESFHCGQLDRQTKTKVQSDKDESFFSQAIHPSLPKEAHDLCFALFEAYPDKQACTSNVAVKRLAESALEGQADLVALMAIQHAYAADFEAIRSRLVLARNNAHAADPTQYDNADALDAASSTMPTSLTEAAFAMWRWIAKEISLDPMLQQTLALKNPAIPGLAYECGGSLAKANSLKINIGKLISKSARVIGYGKVQP